MRIDGKEVARKKMARTVPITLAWDEALDIGYDTLTGVNDTDYKVPFTFTGKIRKITLDIHGPELSSEDKRKLEEAVKSQGDKS